MEVFFKAERLTKYFDSLTVLDNLEVEIEKGEIVGLIGPNGAGKTTFLNIIAGVISASSGKIFFKGRDITNKRSYYLCRLGIVKTAQIVQPFTSLSVFENVYLGAIYGAGLHNKDAIKKAEEIIEFTGLSNLKRYPASMLNVPQRRKLEFARALATEPEILLLDENMAGLTSKEIKESIRLIKNINKKGITIVIVEHMIKIVSEVAKRIIVLNYGKKIADGDPEIVLRNKEVQNIYLGESF